MITITTAAASSPSIYPRKQPPRPQPVKHRWFDEWAAAQGAPLQSLVQFIAEEVAAYEQRHGVRQRARRDTDQRHHKTMIDLIVCNLAYAVLIPPDTGRIATRLGHKVKTRYDNPAIGKPFSDLLHVLGELGWVSLQYPKAIRGETASISPTAALEDQVRQRGISLEDFGRRNEEEVVILRRVVTRRSRENGTIRRRFQVDYDDTPVSRRFRRDLRRLNEFVDEADVAFIDDGLEPAVDSKRRMLRRYFVVHDDGQDIRFDQGGHLFGGFWQNISRQRRANIRINGEPVVELDYGQMFTRLAYAELGREPPEGDLYAIPGLKEYRDGVKLAMNTLLFDTHTARRAWPSKIGVGIGSVDDAGSDAELKNQAGESQYEAHLPSGYGVGKTKRAILRIHPNLKPAWGIGLGLFTPS